MVICGSPDGILNFDKWGGRRFKSEPVMQMTGQVIQHKEYNLTNKKIDTESKISENVQRSFYHTDSYDEERFCRNSTNKVVCGKPRHHLLRFHFKIWFLS
jgi:hypothetical protein